MTPIKAIPLSPVYKAYGRKGMAYGRKPCLQNVYKSRFWTASFGFAFLHIFSIFSAFKVFQSALQLRGISRRCSRLKEVFNPSFGKLNSSKYLHIFIISIVFFILVYTFLNFLNFQNVCTSNCCCLWYFNYDYWLKTLIHQDVDES